MGQPRVMIPSKALPTLDRTLVVGVEGVAGLVQVVARGTDRGNDNFHRSHCMLAF